MEFYYFHYCEKMAKIKLYKWQRDVKTSNMGQEFLWNTTKTETEIGKSTIGQYSLSKYLMANCHCMQISSHLCKI